MVIGSVYNGTNTVPMTLPDKKTELGILTRSSTGGNGYHMLLFDDTAGQERVKLRSQKDLMFKALNNEQRDIGANQTENIGGNETITVGSEPTFLMAAEILPSTRLKPLRSTWDRWEVAEHPDRNGQREHHAQRRSSGVGGPDRDECSGNQAERQ